MAQTLGEALDKYLTKVWALRDLEVWLVARLQQIERSGDERLRTLANDLDADLVEFSEGLVDEATLAARWEGYLRQWSTIIRDDRPRAAVSTISDTRMTTRRVVFDETEKDRPAVTTIRVTHVFA